MQRATSSCLIPAAVITSTVVRSASLGSYRGFPLLGTGNTRLAFRFDLRERPPVAFERGLFASEILPALDDHVNIPRIELQTTTDAFGEFGGSKCGPRAEKRIVYKFAVLCVIQDRAPHALYGFLSAVDGCRVLVAILDLPKRTLFAIAVPMPRRADRIPTRLVLPVIMAPTDHERWLCPDDLGSDLEFPHAEAPSDISLVHGSVLDIRLVAWKKIPGRPPV